MYYVNPKIIPIHRLIVVNAPLKANLSFLINIFWPILPYQLNIMPAINILYESEIISLLLFSLPFLSTFLLICL